MSIASTVARIAIVITALPQTIPVFPFLTGADLLVLDGGASNTGRDPSTVLQLNSDYTVTGGGYDSQNQLLAGNVVIAAGGAGLVLVGDVITILRNIAPVQETTFASTGLQTPLMIEADDDKVTTIAQQEADLRGLCLTLEKNETLSPLLIRAQRLGKILGFDANGAVQFYDPASAVFAAGDGIEASSIAALKAISVTGLITGQQASVSGYYASADGGGGLFVYNSVSAVADNGGTVIAPNVGSGRWIRVPTGAINVRTFGAKGDGTTDDAAAIQAAVNFAYGSPGPAVYLPGAIYRVGTTISCGNNGNLNIFGDGPMSTIVKWLGGAASFVFTIGDGVHFPEFNTISNLTLDGNSAASGGILFQNTGNNLVTNVVAQSCSTGIKLGTGAGGMTIDQTSFVASTVGLLFANAASGVVVQNCDFGTGSGTGISFTAESDAVLFSGCVIEGNSVGVSVPKMTNPPSSLRFLNCFWETNTTPLAIGASGSGTAPRSISFESCLFASGSTYTITAAGPLTINDCTCNNLTIGAACTDIRTSNTTVGGVTVDYYSVTVASGAAVALANGVGNNVASIVTPPPGQYLVGGVILLKQQVGSTAVSFSISGVSTVAATQGAIGSYATTGAVANGGAVDSTLVIPTYKITTDGTKTFYLIVNAGFGGGTCAAYGFLWLQRL